jgi:hypothetical protein
MCGNSQDYYDLGCNISWDLLTTPTGGTFASLDKLDSFTYDFTM